MKKEYKITTINFLYGLIEASFDSLERTLLKIFKEKFNIEPPIHVHILRKYSKSEIWIGTIKISIFLNDETFEVTRNFEEEFMRNILHPDCESDPWFYESEKCFSSQKLSQLLKEFHNNN